MLGQLARRFESSFPNTPRNWRQVGREAEHPLVKSDGTAADIAALWPHLQAGGPFKEGREGDLLISLSGETFSYCSEVGRGTIEVIVGPHQDLNGTCEAYEAGMALLLTAAKAEGISVLGYGIQPRTPATHDLLTPKRRYLVLEDVLGGVWHWFALTASDQVHVEVSAPEMFAQCNLANLLSPLTVALCANSPIYGGQISDYMSGREGGMGTIRAEEHRHGMPAEPWRDADHLVTSLAEREFLMLRRGDVCRPVGLPFKTYLKAQGDGPDLAWTDFLVHDHYMWHSARLRTAQATVELRSACQQPPGEHMAACALGLGMICAGADLSRFVAESLGEDAWGIMARWRGQVLSLGLAAEEPTPGFITGVLERCNDALVARGRSEERYLAPILARWKARMNPAQRAIATFNEGGMPALLEALRWQ